jgi:hypothetical protein
MVRVAGTGILGLVNNRMVVRTSGRDPQTLGDFSIVDLPFGGTSAPQLIGVVGTRGFITPSAPLDLQLDFAKPVKAGTVTISDPAGKTVATLKTSDSTDGSLRGLTWTPPVNAVSGTYTWTANVTDSAGQMAVNTIGNGKASGTFKVRSCTNFTDVPSTHTFASPICWASYSGITAGTGDGSTYSPSSPVNRGAMAAFLHRLAGSPKWDPPTVSPFAGVETTDTFYSALTWLYDQKITVGTTINGKLYYQPTNAVSRGSMAAFLYRFSDYPKWSAPTVSPFADVAKSNTFYSSITWLADTKIAYGAQVNGKLVYMPSSPVNRGAMAAFLQRLSTSQMQCGRYPNAVGCPR